MYVYTCITSCDTITNAYKENPTALLWKRYLPSSRRSRFQDLSYVLGYKRNHDTRMHIRVAEGNVETDLPRILGEQNVSAGH